MSNDALTRKQVSVVARSISRFFSLGNTTVKALNDVDFTALKGTITVLTGASGGGKSTLLNILSLIDLPDSGSLEIDGKVVSEYSRKQQIAFRNEHIGIVFQNFNLMPVLNSIENVALPLMINGEREGAKKKAIELIEGVGMADFKHHKPHELSGGQQQRIAIARALIKTPSILIADEPTAALDGCNRDIVLQLFRSFSENYGISVIYASHDYSAINFADVKYNLEFGRIDSRGVYHDRIAASN